MTVETDRAAVLHCAQRAAFVTQGISVSEVRKKWGASLFYLNDLG